MFIVALCSKSTGEVLLVKRNISKQPLRFDNKAFAERAAHEANNILPSHSRDDFEYLALEDGPFYEEEVDFDDDF